MQLLHSRRKPTGIATRAIVRSGTGHKYWSKFPKENQDRIESLAKEINDILFEPALTSDRIKTLDLPTAGRLYSAETLALVLNFVNITNGITEKKELADDNDGSSTIDVLTKCRQVARRINSEHPGSLGLHPAVYFYSQSGSYKIASFLAITSLVMDLDESDSFEKFTKVRSDFEDMLVSYDYLIQQIVRKYRSALSSHGFIKEFCMACIEGLAAGRKPPEIIKDITSQPAFNYLVPGLWTTEVAATYSDFSVESKSAAFIREALTSAPRCAICGARIHRNSVTIDHIVRKADGGGGTLDNAQLAHPYCNTTYKN